VDTVWNPIDKHPVVQTSLELAQASQAPS